MNDQKAPNWDFTLGPQNNWAGPTIVYRILLTILVTVVSVERLTMSQERLNGLTILSIEQYLLENIEYKSLISNFVAQPVYKVIF